jgi:hypothetical protein
MIRSRKSRFAAGVAVAAMAMALFGGAASAGGPASPPLEPNGSGGVVVDTSGFWAVYIYEQGTDCPGGTVDNPITDPGTPLGGFYGVNNPPPATIQVGTEINFLTQAGTFPLEAGTYQFCLATFPDPGSDVFYISAELEAEIGVPKPTTTTTTTVPTTTTAAPAAPAAAPAAPTYTG